MGDPEVRETMGVRFQPEPHAADAGEVRRRHEANRAGWNEGAEYYARRLEESITFLRGGGSSLHPIERVNLQDLRSWCDTAIHLQCASGEDTLSLWNEGAKRVIGVDISDVHIENARRAGAALGAPATWHRCDVLDVPNELDRSADLVYTGRGALCWLHDLPGWAAVIARLLKPGGIVHVFDDHPVTWLFDPGADAYIYSGLDYFRHSEWSQGWPDSYIRDLGKPLEQQARKFERLWPLSTIVQSLIDAGLSLERLGEHPEGYWTCFRDIPPEEKGRIPLTFSLVARRPRA